MKEIIIALLLQGLSLAPDTNLMLHYGQAFLGTPYVAQTLEVNKTEQLVVNAKEMDCTTFVETVFALALTTRQGSADYDTFTRNLTLIRYRNGLLDGYASRNHYFSQWISSNERQGLVREITTSGAPFTASQRLNLTWMTQHVANYPMLRGDAKAQGLIAQYEREASGGSVAYIPKALVGGSREELSCIEDGDILAIVTSKAGLDTSHIGIASWGTDGRLHLLNASQIHKKVVLEPLTLFDYMQRHPSQLGIRVVRPRL